MKPAIFIFCVSLLNLACQAGTPGKPPSLAEEHAHLEKESEALRATASAFCTELRRERIEGLPTDAQLLRLSPFLTRELGDSIKRARALQDKDQPAQPEEKPEGIEGDIFSSLFEGVTSWGLDDVLNAPGADGTVKVRQSYAEPGQEVVKWTDVLVFKRRDQQWLLNDVLMGGKWQFKSGKSLRSRLPGGLMESQDHDSPDGAWHVKFESEDGSLNRVVITSKNGSPKPFVLFGNRPDLQCTFPSWLIWSQDCRMLALRPGDNVRFTDTHVFRLSDNKWLPVELPKFYAKERKILADNQFRERQSMNDAEYWQDSSTLVIHYFGLFTKADEGDGFDKMISVRFDKKGSARIVDAVDAPTKP